MHRNNGKKTYTLFWLSKLIYETVYEWKINNIVFYSSQWSFEVIIKKIKQDNWKTFNTIILDDKII